MKKRFLVVALVMAFVVVFTAAVMAQQTIRIGDVQVVAGTAPAGGGQCAAFTITGVGAIPDNNPAGVCAPIAVSGLGNTTYVSMTVAATHTWVGDVSFRVTDPSASQLFVMSRPGVAGPGGGGFGPSADFNPNFPVDFWDGAPVSAEQLGAGLSGTQVVCQANGICDFFPDPDGQPGLTNFAGFNGAASTGNWQFCAIDGAAGDTGSINSVTLNVCGEAPAMPSIEVTKTVGTDPTSCATTSSVTVPFGSMVYYCYTMANTGNVTFTHHTVVDDQLGTLLNNYAATVGPGAGAWFTVSAQMDATVTNVVTWTAWITGTAVTASGGDNAQVIVEPPTDVALTTFGGSNNSLFVPVAAMITLLGLAGLYVIRRRQEA